MNRNNPQREMIAKPDWNADMLLREFESLMPPGNLGYTADDMLRIAGEVYEKASQKEWMDERNLAYNVALRFQAIKDKHK